MNHRHIVAMAYPFHHMAGRKAQKKNVISALLAGLESMFIGFSFGSSYVVRVYGATMTSTSAGGGRLPATSSVGLAATMIHQPGPALGIRRTPP
jgi:hypothetical protein